MPLLRSLAVALWLLHCLQLGGLAQSGEQDPHRQAPPVAQSADEPPSPNRAAAVEQVEPDTYLLPDEDGQLQPMLGWTYEDFLRVWKSREATSPAAEEPAFSLQRLECTGRMENENYVHLTARVQIQLHSAERIAVPLAFPRGILTAYTTDNADPSPGDAPYVEFDEQLGEHALWIAGAADATREVRLELLLPVTHRGSERVLKFHAPRAAISHLTLTLPGKGIVAESLTPGTEISSTTDDERTIVNARGLTAMTEIAWRAVAHDQQDVRSLVAESDVHVRAGQDILRTEVTLAVQDLHGTLDRFFVRLPEGHTLDSHELDWATLHPQESADGEAGGATYEVRLTEPQQMPLRLTLALERPVDLEEDEEDVVLRGVEVIGAVRQQGHVHVTVEDNLRVRWEEGQRIRQIATPADSATSAEEEVTASFEFDAADWTLPLKLALRPTEISVEPSYRLEIGLDGVRLAATFRYSVRGTKQFDLRFALGPWRLTRDPQGPETTISADNAYVDDAGTMYLPLANPAEGTFQATLNLELADAVASGPLQFRLPESLDGRVQEGELAVAVDRSLDVIPRIESLLGLAPAMRPAQTAAPPEPLDPMTQRYRVTSLPAEYSAIVRPRTRTVRNETRIDVSAQADYLLVEEEIRLDVRHLPIQEVALRIPPVLARNSSVEYAINGETVTPSLEDPPPASTAADGRIARVLLLQPHLGSLTITVRFRMPWPSPGGAAGSPRDFVVPIVVPQSDSHHVVATLTNQTNHLQVQFDRPAEGRSAASSPGSPPANPGDRSRIEMNVPVQSLAISARRLSTTSQRALVVDRVWVQSFVGGNAVQTRAVMRFVPTSEEIVLQLDPRADLKYVLINSWPVSVLRTSAEEVAVRADDLPAGESCVLEVVQQGAFDASTGGEMRVVPPRIAETRGHSLVYWQLVLPRSLHAFHLEGELVSASPWSLEGLYWRRAPLLSQSDLEEFLGVPPVSSPAGAYHELLYSGVELPPVLEVSLIRRSLVVLLTSGGILAVALAVLYLPVLQRKEFAIAAVIGLAIVGAMYPGLAPFLLQSGVLGLVLTLIAVFLKRLAGQWQAYPARPSTDTASFRQDTASPVVVGAPASSVGAGASSARTLVPSLSDPSVHHSA